MKKKNITHRKFRLLREFRRFTVGHLAGRSREQREHLGRKNVDTTRIVQNTKLGSYYQEYLRTQDTAKFVHQVGQVYTQSTLIRLALSDHVDSRRAAVLALSFLGDYQSNDVFGRLLHDEDQTVRLLAEIGIKNLWPRTGNEQHRQKLRRIMREIATDQYREALRLCEELIAEFPGYAEALNQRAIVHFALKNFEAAIEDATTALDWNPFHFGAATGRGYAYMQLHQWNEAIESFQYALEINPNLPQIRKIILEIEQWI